MSFLGAQNSIALGVQGLIHIDTGTGGGAASYSLAKSLRFRSSASAYLNRTFGTPTNNIKWIWSGWVKRGKLSGEQRLFGVGTDLSGINQGSFFFDSNNTLVFNQCDSVGAFQARLVTNALFRDPAAWYHLMIVFDSANATASNRIIMYVNGLTVSYSTATYPSASLASNINANAVAHAIAVAPNDPIQFFDGEMAEINFVDGQALAPTAFGAYSTYNQWLPIKYAGTYGTNGFYLPFTNTTSTSTLVADSSGNANNWTPNNISLTAGSTYDSLTDVPTLTSETVANYAVLNPLDNTNTGTRTIQSGNLNVSTSGSGGARATFQFPTTGKFYFECVYVSGTWSGNKGFGIGTNIADISGTVIPTACVTYNVNGNKTSGGAYTAYGSSYTTTDTVGIAVDQDSGTVTFYKNNTSQGAITHGLSTSNLFPLYVDPSSSGSVQAFNFGQQPFVYPTLPSGFLPLNTFNIAAGTVTTSGTFTGNASTDGPMVWLNGTPTAMTINGNAVTFGTHADKLANGFKVRSSSASYNTAGSNTYVATTVGEVFKYEDAQSNP